MTPYNLTVQPWIPVLAADGTHTQVSLRALFSDPTAYRCLDIGEPLERFSLHRMLTAIMYRVYQGGLDADAAERLYTQGHDPAIVEYLDHVSERFDLRDPSHPFLQTPGMRPTGSGDGLGFSKLHPTMKTELWTPQSSSQPITPDVAARWLLVSRCYDGAGIHTGMVGDPDAHEGKSTGRGVAQAGGFMLALMHGRDLWETLLLNCPPVPLGDAEDMPAWELDVETVGERKTVPTGPAHVMTWPSRHARLLWDDDGMCVGAYQTNGERGVYHKYGPTGLLGRMEWEPGAFRTHNAKKDEWKAFHATYSPSNGVSQMDLPWWSKWGEFMTPDARPAVFDGLASNRDMLTFETLDVEWAQQSSKIAGLRNERCRLRADRLQADRVGEFGDWAAAEVRRLYPLVAPARNRSDASPRVNGSPRGAFLGSLEHADAWLAGEVDEL